MVDSHDGPEFKFSAVGAEGVGTLTGARFRVHAGSTARPAPNSFYAKDQDPLIDESVLLHDNGMLRFDRDYVFPTSTAAARCLAGASVSGPRSWKLPDGTTFGDWAAEHRPDAVRTRDVDRNELEETILDFISRNPGTTLDELYTSFKNCGLNASDNKIYLATLRLQKAERLSGAGRPLKLHLPEDESSTPASDDASRTEEIETSSTASSAPLKPAPDDQRNRREIAARAWHRHYKKLFDEFSDKIRKHVQAKVEEFGDNATVQVRVKTEDSFAQKAARSCGERIGDIVKRCNRCTDPTDGSVKPHLYYHQPEEKLESFTLQDWSAIHDIIGVRIAVPTSRYIREVTDHIGGETVEDFTLKGEQSPVPTYRGTHGVLNFPELVTPSTISDVGEIPVEFQLRTAFQDAGGRILHELMYKEGEQGKQTLVNQERRLMTTIFGLMETAESEFNRLIGGD